MYPGYQKLAIPMTETFEPLLNQIKGSSILAGTKEYICVHIFLFFNLKNHIINNKVLNNAE